MTEPGSTFSYTLEGRDQPQTSPRFQGALVRPIHANRVGIMFHASSRSRFRRVSRLAVQFLLVAAFVTTALLTFRFVTSNQDLVFIQRAVPHVSGSTPDVDDDLYDRGIAQDGAESVATVRSDDNYFDRDSRNPAILVIAYNRADYLQSVLERVQSLPRRSKFTVYVSQDGDDRDVDRVVQSHSEWVSHLRHRRNFKLYPNQGATNFLARHYHWALDQVFLQHNHSHVIVMEDDLLFAEDSLTFFEQTAPLLDVDPSIWCISSWNDLGLDAYALDNRALFRTDYFPGLGWMLKQSLWLELGPSFPDDHWDQWMRLDTIGKGRSCIVPRVSRNRNIGSHGATVNGDFFDKFLSTIKFNMDPVEDFGDLNYLLQEPYENALRESIAKAEVFEGDLSTLVTSNNSSFSTEYYLFPYLNEKYDAKVHTELQILPVPRALYKGVIVLQTGPRRYLILIDQRISPFCPPEYRVLKHPFLEATAGLEGENCHRTCSARSNDTWVCARDHFQFINSCSMLNKHFPCERGCRGAMLGLDIPNYVSSERKPELHGFCLTTEQWPTCEDSHWSTSRLCPCIPK